MRKIGSSLEYNRQGSKCFSLSNWKCNLPFCFSLFLFPCWNLNIACHRNDSFGPSFIHFGCDVVPALLQCGRDQAWTQIINGLVTSFFWPFCGLPFEAVLWTGQGSCPLPGFVKDKGITDLIQNGLWSRYTLMPLSFLAQVILRSFSLKKSKHKYL